MNTLTLQCDYCKNIFQRSTKDSASAKRHNCSKHFCSKYCFNKSQIEKQPIECCHCKQIFIGLLKPSNKQVKSTNRFCSKSCAATYNNTHKTTGTRRSKLEAWLEQQLRILYPDLELFCNDKTAINSELDFYFPSLSLAFELNGIYHYEPIHGPTKLTQIQNNDNRKFQACSEKEISLCIIDTSGLKYFKEQNCKKYLEIMQKIINLKLH